MSASGQDGDKAERTEQDFSEKSPETYHLQTNRDDQHLATDKNASLLSRFNKKCRSNQPWHFPHTPHNNYYFFFRNWVSA